jgi:hypothetical protein
VPQAADIPLRTIEQKDTVRLISTAYTDTQETVLHTLELPEQVLADLAELDGATNERIEAEQGRRFGISIQELVFGVPEATIINAAFCHANDGGRFHDRGRGAWYAGFEEETAIEEVKYHRLRALRDTRSTGDYQFPFRAFLADFAGEFHCLSPADGDYLAAGPVPECYVQPRTLARTLLNQGSSGIVYPSVRREGGWAIACFRPALVFHVRRAGRVIVPVSLR